MELDTEKIDETVLGLLFLTLHDQFRSWKSMDWDALARLHEKGFIGDPAHKAKSVVLTDAGLPEAARLFKKKFVRHAPSTVSARSAYKNAKVSSANGARGFLCRSAVDGRYFFRIYGANEAFTDYDLRHEDLEVTISPDAMASFYRIGDDHAIDHSPEVLGLQQDEGGLDFRGTLGSSKA